MDGVEGTRFNVWAPNAHYVSLIVPGIGGGEDIYASNGKTAYTVVGLFGGKDIYGDVKGYSIESPFGGTDAFIDSDKE